MYRNWIPLLAALFLASPVHAKPNFKIWGCTKGWTSAPY